MMTWWTLGRGLVRQHSAGALDGPPLCAPARLVPELERVASTIASLSGRLGRSVVLDAIAVLTERAA